MLLACTAMPLRRAPSGDRLVLSLLLDFYRVAMALMRLVRVLVFLAYLASFQEVVRRMWRSYPQTSVSYTHL